jgi:hypothetical protein
MQIVPALLLTIALPLGAQDSTPPAQTPAPAPAPAASDVTVEAVLARTIMDRAPQDSGRAFPADVGQIALWTRVSGAAGSSIRHVWFYGDTEVGNVELPIASSPYRTWTRKQIPAEATGPWHVEVRDANGNVVTRIDFTIGQ